METYYGLITSAQDAIIVLEACRIGKLKRVNRRLMQIERKNIRSGSIFAWDEGEAEMRRWTDARSWSASRVSGNFLIYRELEFSRKKSGLQGCATAMDVDGDEMATIGRRSPVRSDDVHSAGGESSNVKTDGLTKQSFSITTSTGRKQHLIAYHSRNDPNYGLLQAPSKDQTLMSIVIPKDLYPDTSSPDHYTAHHAPLLAKTTEPASAFHAVTAASHTESDPSRPTMSHHSVSEPVLRQHPMSPPSNIRMKRSNANMRPVDVDPRPKMALPVLEHGLNRLAVNDTSRPAGATDHHHGRPRPRLDHYPHSEPDARGGRTFSSLPSLPWTSRVHSPYQRPLQCHTPPLHHLPHPARHLPIDPGRRTPSLTPTSASSNGSEASDRSRPHSEVYPSNTPSSQPRSPADHDYFQLSQPPEWPSGLAGRGQDNLQSYPLRVPASISGQAKHGNSQIKNWVNTLPGIDMICTPPPLDGKPLSPFERPRPPIQSFPSSSSISSASVYSQPSTLLEDERQLLALKQRLQL